MNILFVANRFPYPPFRGDKLKIYNLVKRLSKQHNLYLICFYENKKELAYIPDLAPFFKVAEFVYQPKWRSILNSLLAVFSSVPLQLAYFKNRTFAKKLNKILLQNQIDVVHTQHLRMSQYTQDLDYPKVLDLPDAFSLYYKRRSESDLPYFQKIIDKIEKGRLVKAEAVLAKYDVSLVCSKEDQNYLSKLHKLSNVEILLNGVDLDTFHPKVPHDYSKNQTLLFTGNMDYAPNVDAVKYFVDEMWPHISNCFPNLTFVIAGQRPVKDVLNLASDSIKITGFVPNLCDMYASASVVIAPLRFGAGTQNKVLEAMAMGVPVVCTHIGFEGLGIQSREGVILAKSKDTFIESVIHLLNSESQRSIIGTKGREIAKTRFSWDIISSNLEQYFLRVAKKATLGEF